MRECAPVRLVPFLIEAWIIEISDEDAKRGVELLEEVLKFAGLTWKNYEELIDFADAAIIKSAVSQFWSTLRTLRARVHESALAHEPAGQVTNPLTLFGNWDKSEDFWQKMPERITPAQMLGALIGTCVIVDCLPLVLGAKVLEILLVPEPPPSK